MFEMRAKMITVGLLGAAVMLPIDLAKADQLGHASWYSLPANTTANGERMNPNELTAAHRSLPFGTRVLVENLSNGRSVVVRINDRGPFIGGRIIDLSKAAAASIGMINSGTAKVQSDHRAPAATRSPRSAKPPPKPRTAQPWRPWPRSTSLRRKRRPRRPPRSNLPRGSTSPPKRPRG